MANSLGLCGKVQVAARPTNPSPFNFVSHNHLQKPNFAFERELRGSGLKLMVKLTNDSPSDCLAVHPGDRIAQAMLMPVSQTYFEVVDELSSTDRGAGGFGSTGA